MTKTKGKGGGSLDRVVRVPFRTYTGVGYPNTAALSVMEFDLVLSNLGARAVAIGSAYEYFRFAELRAYTYTDIVGPTFDADATGGTGNQGMLAVEQAVAFIESNATLTGTATTLVQMSQYEIFKLGGPFEKLHVTVPKRLLRDNAYKWFNTASTGAATDDLSPGLFIIGAGNNLAVVSGWTGNLRLVIEGIIEFRGMITPALTFSDSGLTLTRSSQPSSSKEEEKRKGAVTVGSTTATECDSKGISSSSSTTFVRIRRVPGGP